MEADFHLDTGIYTEHVRDFSRAYVDFILIVE